MNQESWDYFNVKSVLALQTHDIINHKLQKTSYIVYITGIIDVKFSHQENKAKCLI